MYLQQVGIQKTDIARFYDSFKKLECDPTHLSVFALPTRDLGSFVSDMDVIYVGGGNTKNLLCLWREWKLDQYFKTANENGTVLAGLSAGAICWFDEGLTDSISGKLTRLKCLGWLSGSCSPHFDSEVERRRYFLKRLKVKKCLLVMESMMELGFILLIRN